MSRALVVLLLVTTLSTPGLAASSALLPYNLVLSPRPTSYPSNGVIAGQFGGVPVVGAYRGSGSTGTLTLTVRQATFMDATYTCSPAGCTVTGTAAGKHVTGMSLSNLSGVGQATSTVFPTRGAWISSVAEWANARLSADRVSEVVMAASTIKISQASNDPPANGRERGAGGAESGGGGQGGGGMMH